MTDNINQLLGIIRHETGKGASYRLRQSGLVPAIVYSGGKEALSIAISPKEATRMLLGPKRRNIFIELALQDDKGESVGKKTVMVRDLQTDKVLRNLIHVDFMDVDPDANVTVKVPLILSGKNKNVTAGGKLEQVQRLLSVKCAPSLIPVSVNFDMSELSFGSTHASDIPLPTGVTLAEDPKDVVITIKQPRADKDAEATTAAAPAAAPAAATKGK